MRHLFASAAVGAFGLLALSGSASAQSPMTVCLITKTDTNPFFVKMKEGAEAKAKELGIKLQSYAGRVDGDSDSQVQAIESCIAGGAKGILIAASDTKGIVPAVKKARDAGLIVIALDTPLEPLNSADATFATDNYEAGVLIGQWAKAKMGAEAANAKIAFLDLTPQQPSVAVLRDQGFMEGFGIDVKDKAIVGDESDKRIVGHDITNGNEEGGRQAMENLLQKDPSINLVYTINEPAAAGAYEALKSLGVADKVTIVSVDGGCPGIANVKAGVIGATSMQYPLKMAAMGVEAVKTFAESGKKPEASAGLDITNTGVDLVTDKPVDGVKSMDSAAASKACWG
ncbi:MULTISPECIES: sugar ABC transporter substrate-binding protein [Aureimonas]|uniref:Sugar ABC transporter n=1 Tax=Aureimonas ureilytica TaxID=401562 RepID=A0A175R832_9HYPH|nr:sugar ABC transporter [Aureimonas ureilytica]